MLIAHLFGDLDAVERGALADVRRVRREWACTPPSAESPRSWDWRDHRIRQEKYHRRVERDNKS